MKPCARIARAWITLLTLFQASCSKEAPQAAARAEVVTARAHDASAPISPRQAIEPSSHHGLAWYVDAHDAAFAAAKAEGKLLFVDLWAAWCHTCLSMREYVLTADNLAPVKDRLVFLALDTERKENAQALQKLPIAAWPTFYLVDGEQNHYGRWVGAASPTQLLAFARDGIEAYEAEKSRQGVTESPLARLIAGDRSAAAGELEEARAHYQGALAGAAAGWSRRPDALVALAQTLRKLGQSERCVELGLRDLEQTGESASATDFSYHVLGCADDLTKKDGRIGKLRRLVEARLSTLCANGSALLTPDDRGDACGLLYTLREKLGDHAGAKGAAAQRLALLTAAAQGLPDAIALTYDFARTESLVQLGRGEQAVALLQARERGLPDDYNPPHYLARVYRDLGRFDEGLAAVERALGKLEGPRRAGILGVKVDLLLGLNRRDEARRVLEEQLTAYRALPEGQRQPSREASAAARLAGLP